MRVSVQLCLVLLLCCISTQAYALRLYTQAQYQKARTNAVATAKNGDLKTALRSLERLLKLEPGNPGATNDYITILVWDGQYQKALSLAAKLDLQQVPEYVHCGGRGSSCSF